MPFAPDDFSRPVYCLLGVPVDAVTMDDVVSRIIESAKKRRRFFLSTPNLNFVTLSQRDEEFRRSLVASDLCPVDGIGAMHLCKKLGIPVTARVAGSDIPASLETALKNTPDQKLSMAFFGGEPGVGPRACRALNANPDARLHAVGSLDPGMLTKDKMSNPHHLRELNAMHPDFLLVALGAQKGQAWIMKNREALDIPVISHLGATINFMAGTVARAPVIAQKLNLEWLWRVKEEPHLSHRYYDDARSAFAVMGSQVNPLARWLQKGRLQNAGKALSIQSMAPHTFALSGAAMNSNLAELKNAFRETAETGTPAVLDARGLNFFDLHFAGLLLILEKALGNTTGAVSIINANPDIARAFRLSGLGYMVVDKPG